MMTDTETSGSKIERLRSGPVPVPCVSPADSSLQGGLSRIPGYLLPTGIIKPRMTHEKSKMQIGKAVHTHEPKQGAKT